MEEERVKKGAKGKPSTSLSYSGSESESEEMKMAVDSKNEDKSSTAENTAKDDGQEDMEEEEEEEEEEESDEEEEDDDEEEEEESDDDDDDIGVNKKRSKKIAILESESSDDGEGDDCPICLNRLKYQDIGTPEACDHNFCLDCIQLWARNVNTCPVDRREFQLILARHAKEDEIFKRIPVSGKSLQNEDDDTDVNEDFTYCELCGRSDREDRLLLCDGCDLGFHCECLDPPLDSVPVEEWFCPDCAEANTQRSSRMLNDLDDMQYLLEENSIDGIPYLRPRRRQIARTRISERVRARIQEYREGLARLVCDDEPRASDEEGEGPSTRLSRTRSQTRQSEAKRKPPRRKQTKKGRAGKQKAYPKKKLRRRTKAPGKAQIFDKLRNANASKSPKSRLAGKLGLTKARASLRKSDRVTAAQIVKEDLYGSKPLTITGGRHDLDPFPDDDSYNRSDEPQASTSVFSAAAAKRASKYSASALLSRQPVARPLLCKLPEDNPSSNFFSGHCSNSGSSSGGGLDLLGSIMMDQNMLNLESKDVKINRDGSLTAKKVITTSAVKEPKNKKFHLFIDSKDDEKSNVLLDSDNERSSDGSKVAASTAHPPSERNTDSSLQIEDDKKENSDQKELTESDTDLKCSEAEMRDSDNETKPSTIESGNEMSVAANDDDDDDDEGQTENKDDEDVEDSFESNEADKSVEKENEDCSSHDELTEVGLDSQNSEMNDENMSPEKESIDQANHSEEEEEERMCEVGDNMEAEDDGICKDEQKDDNMSEHAEEEKAASEHDSSGFSPVEKNSNTDPHSDVEPEEEFISDEENVEKDAPMSVEKLDDSTEISENAQDEQHAASDADDTEDDVTGKEDGDSVKSDAEETAKDIDETDHISDAEDKDAEMAKSDAEELDVEMAAKSDAENLNREMTVKSDDEDLDPKFDAEDLDPEMAVKSDDELDSEMAVKSDEEDMEPETTVKSDAEDLEPEMTVKSDAEDLEPEMAVKSDAEDLEPEMTIKSDAEDLEPEMAVKSEAENLEPEIMVKSDAEDLEPEMVVKSDAEDLEPEMAVKSDAEDLELEMAVKSDAEDLEPEMAVKSDAEDLEPEMAVKSDAEDLEPEMAVKSDAEDLEPEMAIKSDAEDLEPEMAVKSDAEDLEPEMAVKSDAEDLEPEMAVKSDAEDLEPEMAVKSDAEDLEPEMAVKSDADDLDTEEPENETSLLVKSDQEEEDVQEETEVSEDVNKFVPEDDDNSPETMQDDMLPSESDRTEEQEFPKVEESDDDDGENLASENLADQIYEDKDGKLEVADEASENFDDAASKDSDGMVKTHEELETFEEQNEVCDEVTPVSGSESEMDSAVNEEEEDELQEKPKIPISELPRIPKRSRREGYRRERGSKGDGPELKSVLGRVDLPEYKMGRTWEKKDSRRNRWDPDEWSQSERDVDIASNRDKKSEGGKGYHSDHSESSKDSEKYTFEYKESKSRKRRRDRSRSRSRGHKDSMVEYRDIPHRRHSPERSKSRRRDRSRNRSRSGSREKSFDYDKSHKRKSRGRSRDRSQSRKSRRHRSYSRSPSRKRDKERSSTDKRRHREERKRGEERSHKRHSDKSDPEEGRKKRHIHEDYDEWEDGSCQVVEFDESTSPKGATGKKSAECFYGSPSSNEKVNENFFNRRTLHEKGAFKGDKMEESALYNARSSSKKHKFVDRFYKAPHLRHTGTEKFPIDLSEDDEGDEHTGRSRSSRVEDSGRDRDTSVQDSGDSEYDPAFPTESGSPLRGKANREARKPSEESAPPVVVTTAAPTVKTSGTAAKTTTPAAPEEIASSGSVEETPPAGSQGILGDSGFMMSENPNMQNMPMQPQNLSFPMGIRMMPPGMQPGMQQHLLMNPMFLNRPPPFGRLPRMSGPMGRLGWSVNPSGIMQIPPNRFGHARMGPGGGGGMPPGPGLLNGGFEGLSQEPGQQMPPFKQHPCDPRNIPSHTAGHQGPPGQIPRHHMPHLPPPGPLLPHPPPPPPSSQQIHIPPPSDTLSSSSLDSHLQHGLGKGQPSSDEKSASSNLCVSELNQISKLIEAHAHALQNKQRNPTSQGSDIDVFKIPLPPMAPPSIPPPTLGLPIVPPPETHTYTSTSKSYKNGQSRLLANSHSLAELVSESTEVVDMDVASPLDDEVAIELPASPELDDIDESKINMKDSAVIELTVPEDMPASAVELTNLTNKEKHTSRVKKSNPKASQQRTASPTSTKTSYMGYMKKLQIQERVVDEVKLAIKPFYSGKKIDKDEYKEILRKAVPKICHSKSGNINPAKIKALIEAYVDKMCKTRRYMERKKKLSLKANGERLKKPSR